MNFCFCGGAEKDDDLSLALNIFVENKSEALKKKVEADVGHGVGTVAANVADKIITQIKFCEKVGGGIEKSIPNALGKRGIIAKARLQLVKTNLIVIKVTVTRVDFDKMVADQQVPASVAKLDKWLANSPASLKTRGQRFLLVQVK